MMHIEDMLANVKIFTFLSSFCK